MTDIPFRDRITAPVDESCDASGVDHAREVNALLESKLLLKDQQAGFVTWAKTVGGISEPARRDLLSRIMRMDKLLNPDEEKAFLADAAAQRLGSP